jgi:hypothetical protein
MKNRLLLIVALIMVATLLPTVGASASGAIAIPFEKSVKGGPDPVVWSGTAGDGGTIMTSLNGSDVREAGKVWHVVFATWTVLNSGTVCDDFTADLAGVVNLVNGRVSLNGTVTTGDCAGSQIHVGAWLDLSDFSSQGTMLITP